MVSPTTADHVLEGLGGRIEAVIDSGADVGRGRDLRCSTSPGHAAIPAAARAA
jgi:hypothetical protein